ncbi:MAG: response regulator [Ferruginibacter sp.]
MDDDEDIIEVLRLLLSKQYSIRCKINADGICEAIIDFNPDLVMIDNFIGEKNASEIISSLKKDCPGFKAPVLLFSATANIAETAKNIGASDYLEKPASIDAIRKRVKELLGE